MKKFFVILTSLVIAISVPMSTYALTEAQLDMFAQNNILFYDPDEKNEVNCGAAVSNGIYKGATYLLTDGQKRGIAAMAEKENNCNDWAFRTEVSQMANLYEQKGKTGGYSSLVDYLKNGSWYSTSGDYNESADISDEHLAIVEDVLVNGNRNLPPQVVHHDCIGVIEWLELDGVRYEAKNKAESCKSKTGLDDRSLYVSGKTKIHTKFHDGPEDGDKKEEYYIFYRFAGGEDGCGDPFGYDWGNTPSESYSTLTNGNVNYAGVQVWSDAELQAIEANKAFYEEAANQYNIPWQILAVIHSHETNLRRYNPENGQGVYQLYSYTDGGKNENRFEPAESIDEDEFRRQTQIAAGVVAGMAGDLNSPGNIKRLFFRYNGAAEKYIEKAKAMGFSDQDAENGEGSPYVMNRYDARRDPASASMDPLWPGRYVADGAYDSDATSNGFGAFVQYEALAGTSYCSSHGKSIAETAIDLSWEGRNAHRKDNPKPEYEAAMKSVGTYIKPCHGDGTCAPYGASCDIFVSTVIRYSGADPNFPEYSPTDQRDYMDSHPEMYTKIEVNDDVANLEPGDIFVVVTNQGRHIYLYVGEIDGKPYQASASFNQRTGEHYSGVYFEEYGMKYSVYRRINY